MVMKQTEIGVIPEDWEVKELGEIVDLINGRAYSQNELLARGKYRVLRVGNFFSSDKWYWSDLELGNKFYVDKGDLMYAWSASFGPKFWNEEKTIYHYHIWKLDNYRKTDKKFLYHLLVNDKYSILNESQGGTMFHITKEAMEKRKFPLPPLAEQEAIANALSDADAWIEKLEQLIAKKRGIKQGAMQTLLTPKDDWEVKKLGEVCEILNNKRIPIKESERIKGDTPYYGANGIQGYIDGFTHEGECVLVAEDGANDLNNYPINYTVGKIWVNNHAHVLQGKNMILGTRFLSYLLKSIDFQNVLVGGTRAKLNKSVLEQIEIPFPSLSEQERIATILSDMDEEIEALEQQLGKARHIKQGMMQELLTGRTRLV